MEQIIGRITKDAVVRTTKGNTELVAFTVAVNDRYKPKGRDEVKETRYFNCAYFLSTKVKDALRQGTVVSVFGRIGLNAYKGTDGEYHANLTCHANFIEILGGGKKDGAATSTGGKPNVPNFNPAPETIDDLPF
jgi:single-strand DNA-binding protein